MVAKHKRLVWVPALLAALLVCAFSLPGNSHTRGGGAPRPEAARAVNPVKQRSAVRPPSQIARGFEANVGQTDPSVRFLSRGNGRALLLTPEEAVVVLRGAGESGSDSVVRIRPVGANPSATFASLDPLPGRSSYFLGADPKRWITGVPSFARVAYRNVYPGVDLIYYVNDRQVEFDLHLAPGADPSLPVLSLEGAATSFAPDGSLRLTLPQGELTLRAPEIYQEISGRRVAVSGGYVPRGKNRVGFRVGKYDRTKPLVIDPVLSYASYLGGSGADQATGVAVDASGNVYVAGETVSLDLPGAASQPSGGKDIFVTKLGPGAAAGPILYTAYLGGAADETAGGIAVDGEGNVFVAGGTRSADFPLQGALQSSCRADSAGQCSGDVFVAALGPDGTALLFASYLGGSGDDAARALALDAAGTVYLTGTTDSSDFPVLGSLQPAAGASDAFVATIQPPSASSSAALAFATYLGGGAEDQANAIAVGADGSVWVAGETHSADFPTRDAFQPQCSLHATGACSGDAFVARISAPGAAAPAELAYSTFLGGSASDSARGLALDAVGDVLLAGGTESTDFPLANPLQPAPGGGRDAFVARLKADGSALVYSTYLGGAAEDSANAATVDALGNAFVIGTTASDDFPIKDATQPQCAPDAASGQCSGDAFLAVLDPAGGALLFSTYFGGSGADAGGAVAVDAAANAYITGATTSPDLPEASRGVQAAPGGDVDAFLALFEGIVSASRNQAAPDNAAPAITACTGAITWNGSVSTQWNVANNWTPAAVPVATDDVCIGTAFAGQTITVAALAAANQSINSLITNANISFTSGPLAIASPSTFDANLTVSAGTLTLNGATSVTGTFTQSGGVVTGTGGLTVTGLFTWSGGTQSGSGVTTANGGLTLITTTHTLNARTLNTPTAVTWTAGRFDHGAGSVISNTSTWNLQSDDDFLYTQGGVRGVFNNTGTFTKSGGTLVTILDVTFNNTGTGVVNANSGTLQFSGGSVSSAAWNVAATLDFSAGTHDWNAGATITGAGTLDLGATINVNTPLAIAPSVTQTGGTLTLNSATSLAGTLTQTSGTVTGASTLTVAGLFTWAGGTHSGGGVTTANGGLTLTTTTHTLNARTLNTPTAVTWTAGRFDHGQGSVINNTGTWTQQADDDFLFTQGGVRGVFNNTGTFTKSAGTLISIVDLTFNNTGTGVVNVNTGTLQFNIASVSSAAWNVTATLDFSAGTHDWNAGTTITGAGTLDLGATINVNTAIALGVPVTQTGGTLQGTGTLTFNALFTWAGGAQDGGGITNASGGMSLTTTTHTLRNRTLNTPSAVTWTAGRFDHGQGAVVNNSSTWDLQSDDDILFTAGGTRGMFNNSGTFTKSGGTGLSSIDMVFNQLATGVVNANSGTLEFGFDSTSAGDYNVAAVLEFQSGTHTLNNGTQISGAGTTNTRTTVNFNSGASLTTALTVFSGTTTFDAGSSFTGALTVGGGTCDFSTGAAVTLPTLTQTGGTLSGTDTVNVTGAFDWSAGTQDGAGATNANGGWNLTGSVSLNTGRILNNATAGVVSGGGLMNIGNGAVLNNLTGATLDLQNTGRLGGFIGGTHTINNQGTVTRSTSTGTFTIFSTFTNTGTLNVNTGTLVFSSSGQPASTFTGPINVAGTLDFSSGTFDLNAGAVVSGAGTMISSTTVNFNAGSSLTTTVNLTAGTLSLFTGAAITLPSLTQTAGTLSGDGQLDITGAFNWSGGTQDGAGITNANGSWNLTGGVNLNTGRTLNNVVAGVVSSNGLMNIGNGAVLNNLAGATLDLQNAGRLGGFIGGTHAINNQGTITRSTSTGTFTIYSPLNNTGTVSVTSGTLDISSGGFTSTSTGLFSVSVGATLSFGNGTHDLTSAAVVSGAGAVIFSAVTVNLAGTYNITGGTSNSGGTTNLTGTVTSLGPLTITSGTLNLSKSAPPGPIAVPSLTQSGGVLAGADSVDIAGTFNWSGGSQDGPGATNANGGWNHTGGVNLNNGRTLNNAGAAAFSGFAYMSMGNGAVFNNLAGATLDLQNNQSIGGFIGGTHAANNMGTITRSTSTGTFTFYTSLNNTGTVNVATGILSITNSGLPTSTSTGAFNVTGTLYFSGGTHDLNSGAAVSGTGTMQVNATVNFNSGSSLTTAVVMNSGTLALLTGSTVTLPTLTQTGGSLSGDGVVNITGLFAWSGGSQDGTGITNANGGWSHTGGVNLNNGRTLNNAGAAVFSGFGYMSMGNGAVFNNLAGATLDLQNNQSIGGFIGGTHAANNMGTITRSTGTGTFTFYTSLNNSGTVNVVTGILSINNGGLPTSTSTGAFNVTGTMYFSGGAHDLNAGATVSGTGTMQVDAVVNFNSGSSLTTAVVMNRGTLALLTGSTVTLPTLTQTSGSLSGSGIVNITGLFSWSGGSQDGTGITNANGGWNHTGGVNLNNGRTLNNAGAAAFSGFAYMSMGNGAVFNNLAGATLDLQDDQSIGGFIGGTHTVNNMGILTKSGGTGTFTIYSTFNNSGTVNVTSGTLSLNGNGQPGGISTGAFNVTTTLSFVGGAYDLNAGATVSGSGATFISGGTVNFNAGSTISSALNVQFGDVTISTGSAVTLPTLTQSGGTLGGTSTVNITGAFNWSGGFHDGAGATNANAGFNVTGSAYLNNGRTLNNAASGIVNGFGSISMGNGAVLNNLAGATLDFRIDSSLGGFVGGTATVNNMGTLLKTGGSFTTTVYADFVNTGTVESRLGFLSFAASFTQNSGVTRLNGGGITTNSTLTIAGGLFEGGAPGSVFGTINNSGGIVSPGLSPGLLSLSGQYTQGAGGFLNVEIGGRVVGTQFDRLSALSSVNLAGTLNVTLIGGFTPVAGDSFAVLTYAVRSGTFTATNLPALPGGLTWTVVYGANAMVLQVQQAAACTINFDNSNTTNQWQDPANWDTNTLPGPTDRVCINASFPTVSIPSGAHTVDQVISDSPLSINGGSLTLLGTSGNSAVNASFMLSGGGALDGAGTLSIASAFTWIGPSTQMGSGATIANGGASINGSVILRGRTLELPLGSSLSGSINHGQGAVINVPAAASFTLIGAASGFNFTEGGATSTLNNMGSLQKTAGGVSPMQLIFNNAGAVEVFTGTLNFSGTYTQSGASLLRFNGGGVSVAGSLDITGGRVDGSNPPTGPAITGNVNNSGGAFAPGINTLGTMTIAGTYTQGPGGALDIELQGNFAGGFDVLAVSGTASLNGTLNVIQLFGFVPPAGSTYNVITYVSAAGDFATKNGLLIGGRLLTATRQAAFYQLLAVANADLSITNTDSPDPVGTGNTITYTMVVNNAGPDQALNVTVTDPLPASVTFVSSNTTLGSCSGAATVTCNLGTLFNGSVATVTIQVQTTAPGSVSNTATVTSAATDAVPANDSATATTTVTAGMFLGPLPYTCQSDSPFFAGIMAGAVALETFEDGLLNVTGVTANTGSVIGPGGLTDSVDCDDGMVDGSGAGRSFFTGSGFTGITFTFNAAALGGFPTQVGIAWTDGAGTINFEAFDGAGNSLGRVSGNHADGSFSGTTGEDRFYGVINAAGISAIHVDNTGGGLEVDHLQFGPIAGGATVDLSLVKADGPDPVNVGSNLTYFLTVNNPGANLATGVVLTDSLPANVSFVSANPSQGSCSLAGSTVTCNMGGLAPSAVITATIVVTPGAGAVPSITNTATVAAAEADLNTANNSATATTTVNAVAVNVDLVLTKTDSPDPVTAGSNLTYTLTVTNNSATTNATSVQLSDTLPVGVPFVSATPTQGSCSQGGGTVSCNLGAINRTASATVTIVVTPGAAAVPSIINVASVSSAQADTNPADNTASATTSVTAVNVDLALTKTDTPDPASVGGSLTYTLTVTNNGPNAATNVVLTDPLPSTVALTSTSASQGSCSQAAGTVTCNLGTINNAASATVTITVTPGPGAVPSVTNTATVAPTATQTDTNLANNSASAVTTVAGANVDLVLTKTDSPDPVNVGANITYTLNVTNNGPDPATNVALADTLPASVAFVSATPTQGTCTRTGVNVNCSLGTLAASAAGTISIVVTTSAASAPSITNTATVTSAAVETNPADNLASAATTVNPLADLSVSKTDSPDPVGANSTLVYTVTATNNGPSPATSVVITDTLPAGVTFVSASGTCAQAAGTVTCNVGTIASGASSPISISVTTGPAVGGLNNTASVSSAAVPDPNPNNNSITEPTTVVTGPVVTVSTTNLVFASQPVGIASPPQAFAFNNTGNAPVTIVSIVAAGDFAQTSTCGASLAAGASCFVAVTFTPSSTGARNGSVTITHNAPGSPITVSLSGNGVLAPAISLTSVSLVFSTQLLNTTSGAQMVTLTNAGSVTLNLTSIVASGDFAQTNTCGNSVAVGANCIITITFTPTATGIRTGAITIISNAPGSSPVITLTGIGASPGVTISTSLLIFSGQGVGTTSGAQAVTLSNTSANALTISSITITGDFAQSNTCGASLAAGVSCAITVTFTPTQAGPRAGLLTINDSGAGSPRIVSLSGTGLAATLNVAPNSLTFTSQPTGTTSGAQPVTVTNSGGVTVTITGITVSGDFAQANNCPASLAAAASCVINVTFSPAGNGLLTGTVSIANSTPASPHVVNLLGTGVAAGPAVALSVTQLTFAQQVVGAPPSPSQPVTLTNSGNAVLTINSITTAGDFAQTNNCGATLAAAASCVINVTFSPATSGARAGSLTISSDGPGSPHVANLSGAGVPSGPNAGLSASQLSFGTVGMGNTSATQAVTLTNSGNAVLNIISIAASGDFTQTNNCGVSLAIGAGCTITITFAPATSGPRSGAITITDNAAGSPHTIALSGSGSNFTVTPAAGSLNAITVTAGQAAAFSLTLVPSGGFSESVNIACTGAPLGSACTATPGSVTLNTPVNVTIAVTTIARRAETPPSLPRFELPSAPALRAPLWLLLVGMAMMSAALLASRGFGTRHRRHAFAAAAAIVLTVFLGSCAGGVGVPPPVGNGSGTAPGSYTLTITATSASGLSRSTSLTLTVQ